MMCLKCMENYEMTWLDSIQIFVAIILIILVVFNIINPLLFILLLMIEMVIPRLILIGISIIGDKK